MGELGARLAAVPATERAAMVEEMSAARRRAATASRIIIALQVFAIVLMAIGHYV
jgi:hypothetical protein